NAMSIQLDITWIRTNVFIFFFHYALSVCSGFWQFWQGLKVISERFFRSITIQNLEQELKNKQNYKDELIKIKKMFGLDEDDDILQSIGHYDWCSLIESPAIPFQKDNENLSRRHIQSSNDLQTFRHCCDCGKKIDAIIPVYCTQRLLAKAIKDFYYKKKDSNIIDKIKNIFCYFFLNNHFQKTYSKI
ncbi:hypothetical protein RFI_35349, partial [Reticulomyxa filosa]